jgi:8-oxo-dGTP pyrophosphatase MutT (NUDIX family)
MSEPVSRADVVEFLAGRSPVAVGQAAWANGTMPMAISSYFTPDHPPLDLITSVRGVLLRDDQVCVVESSDGTFHLTPGGRREIGETLEQTLRREILEETGWSIAPPHRLGFMHFHHLVPAPAGHPYAHPDFFQLIYATLALEHHPEAQETESEWEVSSVLRPVGESAEFDVTPSDLAFLAEAYKVTRGA